MVAQQDYYAAIKRYESTLDNFYRANNGVFYTDVALAEKIIEDLHIPKEASILDPCCGAGSFLYAASKKGYRNIIGADLDNEAVTLSAKYVPTARLITADTIGNADVFDEQVDYVIGNPPYTPLVNGVQINGDTTFRNKVVKYGKNLFVAALIRALELARSDGGIVSYIIPKNFLHVSSYSEFRKELLRSKTIISIVDLGICFKYVRGEQIVLTIKNTIPTTKCKIKLQKYGDGQSVTPSLNIPQRFFTDEILLFSCEDDYRIYKKLTSTYQTLNDLTGGYIGRGKSKSANAVVGKDIRKFGYKSRQLPTEGSKIFIQNIYSAESGIIAAFGGELEAGQTVTIFTDGDTKMCRYILGILHSRLANFFLYKFCYNNSHLTMHTDAKYLKKIPLPSIKKDVFSEILNIVESLENNHYMSEKWFADLEVLNATVYLAYGIDIDLVTYIDNEMKTTQSKRWVIR